MANMETTQELKAVLSEGWEITEISERNMYSPSHFSFGRKVPLRVVHLEKEADGSCKEREIPLDVDGVTVLPKGVPYYERYSKFVEQRKSLFLSLFEEMGVEMIPEGESPDLKRIREHEITAFLQYHNWYCGGVPVSTLAAWCLYMGQAWLKFKKEFSRADLRGYQPEAQWGEGWSGPYNMDHEMFSCGKDRKKMAFNVIFELFNLRRKYIILNEEERFFLNRCNQAYHGLVADLCAGDRHRETSAAYMLALEAILERIAANLEGKKSFKFGF